MFHLGFNFFTWRGSCLPRKTFLLFHHPSHYGRPKVDLTISAQPINTLYDHIFNSRLLKIYFYILNGIWIIVPSIKEILDVSTTVTFRIPIVYQVRHDLCKMQDVSRCVSQM